MDDDTGRETSAMPQQITFDYIKGAFFRVVHADGVVGGPTPSGNIHMAFFSERGAIPKREVRLINPDGIPGDLVAEKTEVRPAIVREVDFDVVMSLPVALNMINWLQRAVAEMNRLMAQAEKEGPKS